MGFDKARTRASNTLSPTPSHFTTLVSVSCQPPMSHVPCSPTSRAYTEVWCLMPHTLPRFRMSSLTETLSAKDSIFAQPVIHSDTQGLLLILRTTDKLCAAQNVPSGSKAKVLKFKDFGAGKMHMDASEYVLQCLRDTVEE